MAFKPDRWGFQGERLPLPRRPEPPLWFRIAHFSTLTTAAVLIMAIVGVVVGFWKATGAPWSAWYPTLVFFGGVLILGLVFAWARLLADRRSRRPPPPKSPFEM